MEISITQEFVTQHLPRREPESNKGSYGKVLCAVGSTSFRGAALLCAEGALRMGAGIVAVSTVEQILAPLITRLPECVLLPCPAGETGCISPASHPIIVDYAAGCTALAIGCGLGDIPETAALAKELLNLAKPTVLDADGLNALKDSFPAIHGSLVVTPHPGEMARLLHTSVAAVQADRPAAARSFASAQNCVTVLKGHETLVASPDGSLFRNTTGNAGMAKGGSGDILAGIIAALLAQGLSPLDAACCGVWLHGKSGDLCAERLGQYTMLPHDIFTDLGHFLAQSGF